MANKKKYTVIDELSELLSELDEGGVHSTIALAKELDSTPERIRMLVAISRRHYNNGNSDTWIYTARGGYTTDDKAQHVVYEGKMRMSRGMGILMNGMPVFAKMRKVAIADFRNLMVAYKPRMLDFQRSNMK